MAEPNGDLELDEGSLLRHYLSVLWRRRWFLLAPLVLLPVLAAVTTLRQPHVYSVSADVLLNRTPVVETTVAGVSTPIDDPTRIGITQASVARVPAIAARVVAATGVPWSPRNFLNHSNVEPYADLLNFVVRDSSRERAARLATEYARQYTIYRRALDTRELAGTRADLDARVRQLERTGQSRTRLYAALVAKEQQIRLLVALARSNVFVVRNAQASDAEQIAPRPLRNIALAAFLGLVLGLVLAFTRNALDTRLRRPEEIEAALGLPLLGRLAPPRGLAPDGHRLVMLDAPGAPAAESLHALRTSVEFANADRNARSILVTSALDADGKSATAANLAVAFARTGRRVTLVDLDLRDPFATRCFDLVGRPGITDVALGHAALDEVVVPVTLAEHERPAAAPTNGERSVEALLEVVPSGPLPLRASEFVGLRKLAELVRGMRGRAEIVIIDAPPLLTVGDAIALSGSVDALLLVVRAGALRQPMAVELRRRLASCPADVLGVVVTDAPVPAYRRSVLDRIRPGRISGRGGPAASDARIPTRTPGAREVEESRQ
jgi:capsular exopolysaccharide synthesis family protein